MNGIEIRVLKETVYRAGYTVRTEIWSMAGNGTEPVTMRAAYTPNGEYIGTPGEARKFAKRGIAPQLRTPTSSVCSIGYCARERKWYGWSHRAIWGYGVGDVVKESAGLEGLPVGFTAYRIADAKLMAEAFAESVS